jgi:hypothetical protein
MSNKRTARTAPHAMVVDPAHAPGKRHLTLPHDQQRAALPGHVARMHDQPWVGTSGRVGRTRRSGRGN